MVVVVQTISEVAEVVVVTIHKVDLVENSVEILVAET